MQDEDIFKDIQMGLDKDKKAFSAPRKHKREIALVKK